MEDVQCESEGEAQRFDSAVWYQQALADPRCTQGVFGIHSFDDPSGALQTALGYHIQLHLQTLVLKVTRLHVLQLLWVCDVCNERIKFCLAKVFLGGERSSLFTASGL